MSGSILIIDDSVTLLQKIKSHLLLDQYEVVTATTYPEARPHLDRVDLVIIDFHMPGQDGADMVVAFRKALGKAQNPPLLYLHTTDSNQAASYKSVKFDGVIGMKGNYEMLSKQVGAAMRLRRLSAKMRIAP